MRCHWKSNQAFKAATQHPGSSSPPSLLRWGCCSRMCIASFSNSSLLVLAWSITVASSHLIACMGEPPPNQWPWRNRAPVFNCGYARTALHAMCMQHPKRKKGKQSTEQAKPDASTNVSPDAFRDYSGPTAACVIMIQNPLRLVW